MGGIFFLIILVPAVIIILLLVLNSKVSTKEELERTNKKIDSLTR